jgi:hypothetical protein
MENTMRDFYLCKTYAFLIRYKEDGKWLTFKDFCSGCDLKDAITKIEKYNNEEFEHKQAYIDQIWRETETTWESVNEW